MRLLVITGDHGLPDATKWDGGYSESDLEMHRRMCEALESLGGLEIEVASDHSRLVQRLAEDPRPDLVLNLCDTGFRNVATHELHLAALLELHGLPYTGAGPFGMVLAYDKGIVRATAQAHHVPVPSEVWLAPDVQLGGAEWLELLEAATWPSLIKPAQGDGSVGIRPDAVVGDPDEARRYLEWFRRELPGRAALVQEYLSGTEYGLGLVGNPGSGFTAFPPLAVDYGGLREGLAPILAFESKTGPENPYDAVRIEPARLAADQVAQLRRHAELLFERLQCRDYARFDFRTGADGVIKLLEVNPNPAWSPEGKLAKMAAFGGVGYPDMLGMILDTARRRLCLP